MMQSDGGYTIASNCKFCGAHVADLSAEDLNWLKRRGHVNFEDSEAIWQELRRRRHAQRLASASRRAQTPADAVVSGTWQQV
jgi:hypothetical protein